MSDEIRVSIQSDQGIKNQWARGLFYRKDGKKHTLDSKTILWVTLGSFGVLATALVFQGSPEDHHPIPKNNYAVPSDSAHPAIENIPSAAAQASSESPPTSHSARRERGSPGKAQARFTGPQVISRPGLGKIPPGSMVKATLLSGGSNGPVRAEVSQSLSLQGETLIPEGTILVGIGQSSENRLTIRFNKMVFRDGGSSSIEAQACDGEDKIAGIRGSRVGNEAVKLATGIGLNFAGGLSTGLQDSVGSNGVSVQAPTLKNALLNGAATAALNQSRDLMSEARNKPPVIEVPAGVSFYVLFQGE